jgi:quercetin dioxygenase-like cupin family protein
MPETFPRIEEGSSMQSNRLILSAAVALLGFSQSAGATEPAGVVSNVLLAQGRTISSLKEKIKVGAEWAVTLEDNGQSEMYVQDLVIGPGGYTGWHSHPGLLLITMKDGAIDFYDKDCVKTVYSAGQSFSEGADPHALVNTGSVNARLFVAYIVKSGEPRRIERAQPKCGEALRIP